MFDTIQNAAIRSVNAVAGAAVEHPKAAAVVGAHVGVFAAIGVYKTAAPEFRKFPGQMRNLRSKVRSKLHAWSTETPDAPAAPAAAA